jgi:predicted TIM-barrel enzyme
MANRIDTGVQPTAHTAVQAMIVRAQQVADKTGKPIGVHYDLAEDELSLVEIAPESAKGATFIRIAVPAGKPSETAPGTGSPDARDIPSTGLKAAPAAA